MALNRFENVRHVVTETTETIYTAPTGFSAIVILAQATNITSNTADISLALEKDGDDPTFLAFESEIPSNDSSGLLTGKLVLKSGQSISVSGNENDAIQLVLSILESEN